MADLIFPATSADDYAAYAGLVKEYVTWCKTRYQAEAWFVERVFGHQALEQEMLTLAAAYGPPNGKTLLVSQHGQICAGGAYRKLADGVCEMKRLYVAEPFQGQGIGRRLCAALIAAARAERFTLMRLETGNLLTEAQGMYKQIGFRVCPPYHEYPAELQPFLVSLELPLTESVG